MSTFLLVFWLSVNFLKLGLDTVMVGKCCKSVVTIEFDLLWAISCFWVCFESSYNIYIDRVEALTFGFEIWSWLLRIDEWIEDRLWRRSLELESLVLTFSIWGFEMSFDFAVLWCFCLEVTTDPLEDEEGLGACLGLCLFGIGLI